MGVKDLLWTCTFWNVVLGHTASNYYVCTLYIYVGSSPTRGSSFLLGKVTALGVLPCCLFDLTCLWYTCSNVPAPRLQHGGVLHRIQTIESVILWGERVLLLSRNWESKVGKLKCNRQERSAKSRHSNKTLEHSDVCPHLKSRRMAGHFTASRPRN